MGAEEQNALSVNLRCGVVVSKGGYIRRIWQLPGVLKIGCSPKLFFSIKFTTPWKINMESKNRGLVQMI